MNHVVHSPGPERESQVGEEPGPGAPGELKPWKSSLIPLTRPSLVSGPHRISLSSISPISYTSAYTLPPKVLLKLSAALAVPRQKLPAWVSTSSFLRTHTHPSPNTAVRVSFLHVAWATSLLALTLLTRHSGAGELAPGISPSSSPCSLPASLCSGPSKPYSISGSYQAAALF